MTNVAVTVTLLSGIYNRHGSQCVKKSLIKEKDNRIEKFYISFSQNKFLNEYVTCKNHGP